jgi:hypothetical protein
MKQLEPGNWVMTYQRQLARVIASGQDQYGEWVEIDVDGEVKRVDRIELAKVRVKHG